MCHGAPTHDAPTHGMQAVFADALPRVAVAALNWRGLGGLPLTSPRPYSAACHADVAEVLTLTLTLTPILILTLTLTLTRTLTLT